MTPEAPSVTTNLASSTTSSATALPQPTAPAQALPITLNAPSVAPPSFVALQPSSGNDGAAANAGSLLGAAAIKVGSADAPADFLGSGFSGYQPAIGATGVALTLTPTDSGAARDVLNMNFVGANAAATSSESGTASLTYGSVWAGIGVTYSSSSDKLDFSFDIAPGGNPALAMMQFPNDQLSVNSRGDLIIALPDGRTVTEEIPLIYQTIDGAVQKVSGGFGAVGNIASISVQNYNHQEALIIDPVLDSGPQVNAVVANGGTAPILSATKSSSTVTITTDGPSGFSTGQSVLIAGVDGTGSASGYNGTFAITGTSGNTFTYADASASGSSSDIGTATPAETTSGLLAGAQGSMVDSVVYTFSEPVNLDAAAFSIALTPSVTVNGTSHSSGYGTAPGVLSAGSPDGGTTWVVTFGDDSYGDGGVIANSIADGMYTITLSGASVVSQSTGLPMASNQTDQFYRLFGDVAGTMHVTNVDSNAFNRAWGSDSTSSGFVPAFDYDDSGDYTSVDSNAFDLRFSTHYTGFTPTLPFVLNGLGSVPNQTTEIGVPVDLTIPFGNPDGDTVTYGETGLPTGLSETDGVIDGTPTAAGTYSVTITASDADYFPTGSGSVTFTWTVTPVQIGNQVSTLGTDIALQVPFTNPYGDTPYFTADGLPSGLSINSSTGLITGVVNALTDNIPADDTVNIYAATSGGEQLASFQWVVIGVPSVTVPGPQSTAPGTALVFESANANAISVGDSNASGTIVTVGLSVSNGTLTLGTTSGVTLISGTGTDDTSVSFSGTVSEVNSALSGLSYSVDVSTIGPDELQITADDPDTLGLDGANEALQVVDIAVGPTVSVPAAQATPTGTALTFSNAAGDPITVTDSGSSSDTLQVTLSVAHGTLALATTSGLSFTSGASGNASMTFTGTAANINAALDGVADTPSSGFGGDDTLNITVNDSGTLTNSNGAATGSVAIAVGDRPSVSIPGVQGTDVDTPLVFSSYAGTAISVSDTGATDAPVTVQLSVAEGTLSLATLNNLTFVSGANGDASMKFTGTVGAVNAALNGLVYASTYVGEDLLTVDVDDANTIATGNDQASGTVNIVIGGPTLNVPTTTQMLDAGNSLEFNSTNGNSITVGDGASGATLQVSLSANNGTLTLSTTSGLSFLDTTANGSSSMTFTGTATDINSALTNLTYAPSSNVGGDSISVSVDDPASLSSLIGTASGTISVVYGPTLVVPGSQDTDSATPIQFSAANGDAISVADPDGSGTTVYVALAVASGTLSLNGTSGLLFNSGTGTDDTAMNFYGTVTDVNAALDGLTYAPNSSLAADGTFYDALSISVDDTTTLVNGNTATGSVSIEVDPAAGGPSVVAPQSVATNVNTALDFSNSNSDAIVVGDSGSSSTTLTVSLSDSNGTLTLATTSGITITAGSNNSAGMTVTGTAAEINTALNGLSFSPTTGSNAGDDLSISVDDPTTLAAGDGQADADISIAFGPSVSGPGVQATLTGTPLIFSNNDGDPISVGDSGASTTNVYVNLSVGAGTLALAGTTGITITSTGGYSSGVASMAFYGTAAADNAALDGLQYSPGSVADNQDVLSVTVNDPTTNTYSAGESTASVPIVVGGPVATMPPTQSTNSAIPEIFSPELGNGIVVIDPIAGSSGLQLTLSTSNGTLTLSQIDGLSFSSGTGANNSSMTFAGTLPAINAALDGLTYTQSSTSYVGTATITAEAYDSAATGSTTVTTSVAVDVGGPSISVPGNQWTSSGTALTLSSGNSDAINVGDPGGSSTSLAVTLTSSDGTLTLASTTGLTFAGGTANGEAYLSFSGTVSAINTALNAGLTYTPSSSGFLGGMTIGLTADETSATMPETAFGQVNVSVGGQVVAVPVTATTTQGTATSIDVLDSASQVGTGTLTISAATVSGGSSVGTAAINTSASPATIVFTPSGSFSGTATISYTITDGTHSSTATITVAVAPTPTINAAGANASTTASTPVAIPLSVSGASTWSIQSVSAPENGSVTISGSSVVYTPNAGFSGMDNFSYTVVDSNGNTSIASVDISVVTLPTNYELTAPVQGYSTVFGTPITMDVVAQDSGYIGVPYDLDGPYALGTTTYDGTLTMSGSNIVFTPYAGGFAQFTYKLNDIFGNTVTGLVTIAIGGATVDYYVNNTLETTDDDDNAVAPDQVMVVQANFLDAVDGTTPQSVTFNVAGAVIVSSLTALASTGVTSVALNLAS